MMRLYIGTLHTIENEFDECVQSINAQTYKSFDHYVFKNLPNKEAHVILFKSFLERANEYDVLVKVDADMVLANDALFTGIVSKLKENPWAEIFMIAVHDFFSDQLIWGLAAFRNSVRWDFEKETLFVDRPEVPTNKYLFDNQDLAPAAVHCKKPSPYQAFHYGVHRGLKVIHPSESEKKESSIKTHSQSLERTWEHFQRTGDVRLGLASLGAELAYRKLFTAKDLDYSNPNMKQVLDKYLLMDTKMLANEIRRIRFLNFAFLPNRQRRKVLRFLYRLMST
jgi:hypothetical protein